MPGGEREQAIAFMRARDAAQADRVEPFAWGRALVTPTLPQVHDLSFLLAEHLEPDVGAADLAAEAERILGTAGIPHRRVNVQVEAAAARLAAEFAALGWQAQRFLVMVQRRDPDRLVDLGGVLEVALPELREYAARYVRSEPYGRDEEVVRQLLAKDERVAALPGTRAFAVIADGTAVSACHLYSDGETAQIESVATLQPYRGRGYARAVVQAALQAAAGHALVFLVAEHDDWPQALYRKLGFETVGTEDRFLLTPAGLRAPLASRSRG